MWTMILLLTLSWLFPPWTKPKQGGVYWEALFDTAKGEQFRKALGYTEIDYRRLIVLDAVVLAMGIGLFLTFRTRK